MGSERVADRGKIEMTTVKKFDDEMGEFELSCFSHDYFLNNFKDLIYNYIVLLITAVCV